MSHVHQAFLDRQPALEQEMGEPLFVSGLVGPLRIFQRLRGHRHSIDDATTAWYALQKRPPGVTRVLDLGTGIGSVGLAVLHGLGEGASLTCIEAQSISYTLLVENIRGNQLGGRVRALHGDLRDLHLGETFPLVTGSPPYFPHGTGSLPWDSQKAHARFELRGDVGDYAKTARRHLTPDGIFIFCFPYLQKARGMHLVAREGFKFMSCRDVIPMPGKPPLFTLFSASLWFAGQVEEERPLIVANEHGRNTTEMQEIQRSRGFGPEGTNRLES